MVKMPKDQLGIWTGERARIISDTEPTFDKNKVLWTETTNGQPKYTFSWLWDDANDRWISELLQSTEFQFLDQVQVETPLTQEFIVETKKLYYVLYPLADVNNIVLNSSSFGVNVTGNTLAAGSLGVPALFQSNVPYLQLAQRNGSSQISAYAKYQLTYLAVRP
ncbi:hypothetical protein BLD44_028510 [Mastigocladus laminosus UU774]|nr:hypothetical protein BLD44_028510 [Mastigocladus laminosus UU774]